MEMTLTAEQWDEPAPKCPKCTSRTQQDFKPFAIAGSASAKAHALAEDIAANDYNVANMTDARKEGDVPKVRYRDQSKDLSSQWTVAGEALQKAVAHGRQNRIKYGSGLDVLQSNLKSGKEPDLIEASKKRLIRVY
jgi:hypothetical protein